MAINLNAPVAAKRFQAHHTLDDLTNTVIPRVINVAAITAVDVTSLLDGQIIVARGRTTAGDGGGGPFTYSATSTATPDGGIVFAPSVGSGRLLRDGYGQMRLSFYGADTSGVADCASAATAAQAATTGRVYVGPGVYNLASNVAGDWDIDSGVTYSGAGKFVSNGGSQSYSLAMRRDAGLLAPDGTHTHTVTGVVDTAQGNTLHSWLKLTNNGPQTGYGQRIGYTSYGYGASDFDLCQGVVARWERTNTTDTGGTGMNQWLVSISPQQLNPACAHRTTIAEWNVVYRGIDYGWQSRRSNVLQSAVFLQVVPEAKDFTGSGGTPKNILAGLVFTNCPSGAETDALGYRPRMYNCLLGEPNSVHETGYAIYWSGSDGTGGAGGGAPVAFARLAESWQSGYRTDSATFTLDPVVLGSGQGVTWVDGSGVAQARQRGYSDGSMVEGLYGTARGVKNSRAWAPSRRSVDGDTQHRRMMLYRSVSSPSNVAISTDGTSATVANSLVLPVSGAVRVRANVLARSATPSAAGWEVTALARRNSGTTVTIVSSTVTKDTSDAGAADWTLTLAANNTTGALEFQISGTGSFSIIADCQIVDLA